MSTALSPDALSCGHIRCHAHLQSVRTRDTLAETVAAALTHQG